MADYQSSGKASHFYRIKVGHFPIVTAADPLGVQLGKSRELALHGYSHPRHEQILPQAARDEVARGMGAFEAAVGRRPELMRPPYGRFSEHSYRACRALGLEPVYWSAWALDWEELPPERIVDLACRDLASGMIVLLHDSPRYAERRSALATAQAVAGIAERAAELGLQLGPIGA